MKVRVRPVRCVCPFHNVWRFIITSLFLDPESRGVKSNTRYLRETCSPLGCPFRILEIFCSLVPTGMNIDKWDLFTLKHPLPVPAPTKDRKERQIPEPPEVRVLEGAVSARHDGPHRYLVGSIKPGPQPCLVEVQRGVSTDILPELIVVPDGVTYSRPTDHAVYGRLLALLAHLCRNHLDDARNNEEFDSLAARCTEDAPFRNVHWYKLLDEVTKFVALTRSDSSALPPFLAQAANDLQGCATELAGCWEPYAFFIPAHDLRGWAENKYLIERWPEWETAKLTPTQRLRKFRAWTTEPLPSDAKELRTAMDTFRDRWWTMRLECSVDSMTSRTTSRWKVWLSEEAA